MPSIQSSLLSLSFSAWMTVAMSAAGGGRGGTTWCCCHWVAVDSTRTTQHLLLLLQTGGLGQDLHRLRTKYLLQKYYLLTTFQPDPNTVFERTCVSLRCGDTCFSDSGRAAHVNLVWLMHWPHWRLISAMHWSPGHMLMWSMVRGKIENSQLYGSRPNRPDLKQ